MKASSLLIRILHNLSLYSALIRSLDHGSCEFMYRRSGASGKIQKTEPPILAFNIPIGVDYRALRWIYYSLDININISIPICIRILCTFCRSLRALKWMHFLDPPRALGLYARKLLAELGRSGAGPYTTKDVEIILKWLW